MWLEYESYINYKYKARNKRNNKIFKASANPLAVARKFTFSIIKYNTSGLILRPGSNLCPH